MKMMKVGGEGERRKNVLYRVCRVEEGGKRAGRRAGGV